MTGAQVAPLDALRRQANRLRFTDAALERQFQSERVAGGILRSRVMLALGMLVLTGLGFVATRSPTALRSPFLEIDLQLRFFGVVPIWLAMFLSTFVPEHGRRAGWLNAVGTTVVCWFVALGLWHRTWLFPADTISGSLTTNLIMVLVPSAVILPMRFREIAVTVIVGAGAPLWFSLATLPAERAADLHVALGNLTGFGLVILALSWYREAAERLMFAQREHMRGLNAELTRLNAEKNEFMAIASHDLRAPLASAEGLAEQLESGAIRDPQKVAQANRAIIDLTGRMLRLVNDYLGAHAAETGALPLQLTTADLQAFAEGTAARFVPLAERKRQRVEVLPGPAFQVRADPALLAQVADNFVSNALKFSAPGAVVRLGVAVAEDGSVARLEVIDEGPGIAREDFPRLFTKFGKGTARATAGESSVGLGLAVAKRLAEAMNGRVGCESPANERGTGAIFWVELPAAVESSAATRRSA